MRRSCDDIEDELLVLRCQNGEREAFDALVARWQPRLWRLAGQLTADRGAAGDLAQEAWLAIMRGLHRLDDPARFRVWAYRIVANKCTDWIRRRSIRRDVATQMRNLAEDQNEVGRESAQDATDELARMRDALQRLPDELRTVVSLHYLDGMNVRDIAVVLDVPVGTIKSRLHNARERLRTTIQRDDPA